MPHALHWCESLGDCKRQPSKRHILTDLRTDRMCQGANVVERFAQIFRRFLPNARLQSDKLDSICANNFWPCKALMREAIWLRLAWSAANASGHLAAFGPVRRQSERSSCVWPGQAPMAEVISISAMSHWKDSNKGGVLVIHRQASMYVRA